MTRSRTIVFAGGGSGGHIMPGLAIAERLDDIAPDCTSVFFCSNRDIDRQILAEAQRPFYAIESKPLSLRPVPLGPIRFLRGLHRGTRQARAILREIGASAPVSNLVAVGGFVAAPSVRAASSLRIPVTLLNLDVVPGKANRFMARYADRIVSAVSCPGRPNFNRDVVGMPLRKQAIASDSSDVCRQRLGLDPDLPTLLITGASQGAGTLNDFMLAFITGPGRTAMQGWQVYHLCGEDGNKAGLLTAYEDAGVPARVDSFTTEMHLAWGAASLALSRAGASSVAEAAANAIPAVFAPYPWHRDEHQRLNAQPLVDRHAAWLASDRIDPTENLESIGPLLTRLLGDPEARRGARRTLETTKADDAARIIAERLI